MANSNYFWTEEDVRILRESYTNGGLGVAVEKLPGRSRGEIATKAFRLRITKAKPRNSNSIGSIGNNSSDEGGISLSGQLGN